MLWYTLVVFLYSNGSGFLNTLQAYSNEHIKAPNIEKAFNHYKYVIVKNNVTELMPYIVFSPQSYYSLIYIGYNGVVITMSFASVSWFTVKIIKTLRRHRHNMSTKTYSLNKQINQLLLIQVSIRI